MLLLGPFSLLLMFARAVDSELTDGQVDAVSTVLEESALLSWELGTRSQAILELNATRYAVFSPNSLPPPASVPSNLTNPLTPFFAIAQSIVANRSISNNHTVGPQPLIQDGSAADPASIGISVLLANWTRHGGGQLDYSGAAQDQLDFVLTVVPRTSDGAISHRVSQVQLWSDFVYMVPPFLAYFGVITRNRTLLEESYNQIKLYRSYLRDPQTGMWRHIMLGSSGNDTGSWTTGNGWVAAGILRVLATIRHSEYNKTFTTEQSDLASWVQEIHSAIYPHLDSTNVFTNYPDQPVSSTGNFYDAASTALLASTVYRAAVMLGQFTYLPYAERSRTTLFNTTSSPATSNSTASFDGFQHITTDGWLTPVVNPHQYGIVGNISAEAQAFVVQLHSAHRDWVLTGSKHKSVGMRVLGNALSLRISLIITITLGLIII